MTGHCTYTVEARTDDGDTYDVPCGKRRVGRVEGPGVHVVVCRRHWEKVALALTRNPAMLTMEEDEA